MGKARDQRPETGDARGLLQQLWETSPVLAWVKAEDLRYACFSPAYFREFGEEPSTWLGKTDAEIYPPDVARQSRHHDLAVLASGQAAEFVESITGPGGALDHFLVIRYPFMNGGGRYLAGVCIRIAAEKIREYELARRAVFDDLTGLYNRNGFQLFSEHELKAARRRGARCAVVCVDIEDLAQVNESLGRHEGDVLLVGTGILLRHAFNDGSIVCRTSGGAFAVFVPNAEGDPAELRARVLAEKDSFPFSATQRARLRLGIGVASFGPDDPPELSALVAAAELALYHDHHPRGSGG